ncbi:uncharacterized protein LOC131843954 [Achroia grisella]|uniref:uncharacterized protein LOC131843954 n=1 Tax=Achroia grisella TaxID=688607 RepID=UPI0027D2EBE0|nr:uncharacterized protein LOC131843954 [Achroia grisella]
MADIDKLTLMKTKLKHLSIKTLHCSSKSSFCWKNFGLLMISVNGKKRFVPSDQVFCMVCLEDAKNLYEDELFGSVKVKSYSKKISTGNLMRHLREEHQIMSDEPRKTRKTRKSRQVQERNDDPQKEHNIAPYNESKPRDELCESQELKEFANVGTGASSKALVVNKISKWKLGKHLALWLCRSLLPFDSINDEAMIELLKNYNVTLTKEDVPSQSIIRCALDNVYECTLECIKQSVTKSASQHVAITTDLWSDCYRHNNYITITLHFLNELFTLENITLATQLIIGPKTTENISDYVLKTLQKFDLLEKHIVLVSKTEPTANKMATLLSKQLTCESHYCLGKGLHDLIVVDGIKNTTNVFNLEIKCKNIINTLRFKQYELEDLIDKEEQIILSCIADAGQVIEIDENVYIENDNDSEMDYNGIAERLSGLESINKSIPTRWDSTLTMFESLYNKYNIIPINRLLNKLEKPELILNESEWLLIQQLTNFLAKFRDCVLIMSAQNSCTINMALVFKMEVAEILDTLDINDSLEIFNMKTNMKANLDCRFPTNKLTVAATLLDCRFQTIKEIDVYLQNHSLNRVSFLASYIRETVSTNDTNLSKNNLSTTSKIDVNASPKNSTSLLIQLAMKYEANRDSDEIENKSIEIECCKYFAECDPQDLTRSDILSYWNERRVSHPYLSTLAKKILCTPATTVPSERMFSIAGLTTAAKRSQLSGNNGHNINKILFVHDNYNKCKNYIDNI